MSDKTTDESVLRKITRLVEEEQALYGGDPMNDEARARVAELTVELDQCWDLLRQRRAKREFGESESEAQVRPPETVEKYLS